LLLTFIGRRTVAGHEVFFRFRRRHVSCFCAERPPTEAASALNSADRGSLLPSRLCNFEQIKTGHCGNDSSQYRPPQARRSLRGRGSLAAARTALAASASAPIPDTMSIAARAPKCRPKPAGDGRRCADRSSGWCHIMNHQESPPTASRCGRRARADSGL
jgi:hypothetical protein